MLEGLEAVEMKLSDVLVENETFRFDSEYLKKEYLENIIKIQKHPNGYEKLQKYIKQITGGATPLGANYFEDGVLFIRVQNIMQNYFNFNESIFISQAEDKKLNRSKLKYLDVLLTITGVSYGKSAIVTKDLIGANINQHSVKITLNNNLNSYFLSTFLNSKFGKLQSDKNIVGISRPALDYSSIKSFLIPILSQDFQNHIEYLVTKAHQKTEESKSLYQEAEQMLLKELDLVDFKPSRENIAIKKLSDSFGSAGRLDAEYYQPKYEEIVGRIKKYRGHFCELNDLIIDYSTGYPYKSESYQDEGISLIRINNIKSGILDLSNATKIPYKDKNLSKKDIVKENDLLISMSGTIGSACKIHKDIEAVVNQRIMRATINNFSPDITVLLINSFVGVIQLERIGTGGVQTNISANDIKQILIPLISTELQQKIESKIQQSFALRKESYELLDLAKKAVEVAIDKDEEEALKLIEPYLISEL